MRQVQWQVPSKWVPSPVQWHAEGHGKEVESHLSCKSSQTYYINPNQIRKQIQHPSFLQIMEDSITFSNYLLAPHLGGLDLTPSEKVVKDKGGKDKEGQVIVDAKAMRLVYILDSSEDVKDLADAWEDGALQVLQVPSNLPEPDFKLKTYFRPSKITAPTSRESRLSTQKAFPGNLCSIFMMPSPTSPLQLGWSFPTRWPTCIILKTHRKLKFGTLVGTVFIWNLCCMLLFRSRVGILGLVNTIMATVFAWGVLGYIGCPWQAINLVFFMKFNQSSFVS